MILRLVHHKYLKLKLTVVIYLADGGKCEDLDVRFIWG